MTDRKTIDETDRLIIKASQAGLALDPRPYHVLAEVLDLDVDDVMARFFRLLDMGVIRRIGAVPNHYRLGYHANGMSVWDVDDQDMSDAGNAVGALDFVSHCYHRSRHLPDWPYNLFAMVHGLDRAEVEDKVAVIEDLLGPRAKAHEILYSTRILKKTGLRLVA